MTDQQISAIINAFRYTNRITPLQKDILDTWDMLHKNPFDTDSAHKQIVSNNVNHLDIFAAINAMPGVIQKSPSDLTQNDMVFTLRSQLEGLIAKELGALINGDHT